MLFFQGQMSIYQTCQNSHFRRVQKLCELEIHIVKVVGGRTNLCLAWIAGYDVVGIELAIEKVNSEFLANTYARSQTNS
jgi:hypothetical protein